MTAEMVQFDTTAHNDSVVSGLLRPTAPPPEPARRVNFVVALLLYWLLPRRYGPHLAAGSWKRALLTHALSWLGVLTAISGVALVELIGDTGQLPSLHSLRIMAAESVVETAAVSAAAPLPWAAAVALIGFVPLVQVAIFLVGTAAMPFCAGGDRASSVWKRSVKNVYWSTTFAVPIALVVAVLAVFEPQGPSNDMLAILLGLIAVFVPVILWLRMIIVGAGRYVGPPDGPAFAEREPRCDECGYTILGLPVAGRCPECSLPIADSLPPGRRPPTRWQQNELRPAGFADLLRMQFRVVRGRDVFSRLPVHSGMSAARHFWWATYGLMALIALGCMSLASALTPRENPWEAADYALMGIPLAIVPFVFQSAMMLAACLWAQFRLGVADYRVSAIACYYASPLMWPVILVLIACAVVAFGIGAEWFDFPMTQPGPVQALSLPGKAAIFVFGVFVVLALIFWWLRLLDALRAVRYANA